ncbi:hypothetical protein K7432_012487 [Basidiobolus ranarum]|uniref:SEC7 domain-containing protein n=1 Tax=Basidiobolus ranarum TaxID=34480 RepID=A0ABR2VS80_9FUNG
MEEKFDSEDMLANKTSKNFDKKVKQLAPRGDKLLMHYPNLRTSDTNEVVNPPSVVQTLVKDGLLPLGKDIKVNRVQLNTRTSTEMRLTKEKLCKVILEGTNQPVAERVSATFVVSTISENRGYNSLAEHSRLEFYEKPDYSACLTASSRVFVTQCNILSQQNTLSICSDRYSQFLSNMGPSFFLTTFSDRLNLTLTTEGSIETPQILDSYKCLSTNVQPSVETLLHREPAPSSLTNFKLTPDSLKALYNDQTELDTESPKRSISKLKTKYCTSDIINRNLIQRGCLGNLRADSNIKITTSITCPTRSNQDKVVSTKITTEACSRTPKSLQPRLDQKEVLESEKKLPAEGKDKSWVNGSDIPISLTSMVIEPSKARQVLLHDFAYQIINTDAVKLRYLFLFDDLLVVTKPIGVEKNQRLGLHSHFQVKHCIVLDTIHFKGIRDSKNKKLRSFKTSVAPHPVFTVAVRKFKNCPWEGVKYMIDKSIIKTDPNSIAGFLHKTPGLSKKQLGKFLGMENNHSILAAFLDKCKLFGLRIDDALRVFLASFRLPGEGTVIDYLVKAFAKHWYELNQTRIQYDLETCTKFVFYVMALNADLHNKKCSSNSNFELPDFVSRFQDSDIDNISEELLTEIYTSIQRDKLETAVDEATSTLAISVECPETSHMGVNEMTEITIQVSALDKNFRIKPVGDGLVCEPEVLDFTCSTQQTLKFRFNTTGRKWLTFIKLGSRAQKYCSIPRCLFTLEPSYMRNSILVEFPTDAANKTFLYGFENPKARDQWSKKLSGMKRSGANSHPSPSVDRCINKLSPWTGYDLIKCFTE